MIIIRGGGDIATGTIRRLWGAGFKVVVLECEHPSAIRRQVSVCEAVYEGQVTIENMQAIMAYNLNEAEEILKDGKVPVVIDPKGKTIDILKPDIVIDAILAKKNMGTLKEMAPLTIALGPGFEAGKDTDIVIETKRGHNLGRIITEGSAYPDTGIPGNIGGYTLERVIHAPSEGIIKNIASIGDVVNKGDEIALISSDKGNVSVYASITGILRGIIKDGYKVTKGFKIADIDPRKEELSNCFTISDKARCISGSVLEVVCSFLRSRYGKII